MIPKIQNILAKARKVDIDEEEVALAADEFSSVEQKIRAIMAKVFKIDIDEISEAASTDTIDQWTSLEHVDFVLSLQKEFDIEFTDSQIVEELLSYKTAVETVTAAINAKNK